MGAGLVPSRVPVLLLLLLLATAAWHAGAEGDGTAPKSAKEELQKLVEAPDKTGMESPIKEIGFEREKEVKEDYHATMNAFLDRFEREQATNKQAPRPDLLAKDSSKSGLLERLIGSHTENSCGINESTKAVARENLVVLPAGDNFDVSKWMNDPKRSNWDIIIIYYGKNKNFSCPLCKAVYRASGPKWRLVWGFTLLSEWQEYKNAYKAIMFPDDDLVLDVCTINSVFSIMKAYKLLAAQPSLCDAHWSYTPWKILYQQKKNILRYTTMIEIMAPAFEMDYFQNFVRPSLYNAYVGWGLDFVWPFLLRYPRNKIAVVDQVCMFHPPSTPNKANSVYNADAPYRKKEEETRRFSEYGYFESEIEKHGFYFMAVEVVGVVPKPNPQPSLLETSNKALQQRLGHFYPLLLLLQTLVILFGALCMLRSRIRGHCRLLQLRVASQRKNGKEGGGGSGTGREQVVRIPAYVAEAEP